jgi:hypothetical protein
MTAPANPCERCANCKREIGGVGCYQPLASSNAPEYPRLLASCMESRALAAEDALASEKAARERAEARLAAYLRPIPTVELDPLPEPIAEELALATPDKAWSRGLNIIPSVKAYRQRTGAGLRQSKDAIDRAFDALAAVKKETP